MLEDRGVFPVVVVSLARHRIARETKVMLFLKLERLAFGVLIQPAPRRLQSKADRIAVVVIVPPFDAPSVGEKFCAGVKSKSSKSFDQSRMCLSIGEPIVM